MQAFIENPTLLIHEFTELIEISQRKAYITIGIEIQKEEVEVLKKYREDLGLLKTEFITRKLEAEANLVYCIENSIRVIELELEMLINIKEDKMSEAWGNLVNAQVTISTVICNYPFDTSNLDGYVERLAKYENLLFPKMYFQSIGGIIKKDLCSICNNDFGECDHIKGKLYNGNLCCRLIKEMTIEEVSLVETPANKHCRVLTIETKGKVTDLLTLRSKDANDLLGDESINNSYQENRMTSIIV